MGVYGLIAATISYALYFLGLDFYTFAGREIARADQSSWPAMLRDQGVLYGCSYLVVLPLLSLVFLNGILPIDYMFVFYGLLIAEHLSQECLRFLVIIQRPLAGGVLLFIRVGAWCYVLATSYFVNSKWITLNTVLWSWCSADLFALILGIWLIRNIPFTQCNQKINWSWVKKGIGVASVFLLGTLALRGIFTLDRYLVEHFAGKEMLGVYTLYFGIANSVISFVDAGVFSFRYPKLISIFKSGDLAAFEAAHRSFARQTLIAVAILGGGAAALAVPVLTWIGKPVYLEHLPVYFTLLAVSMLFVIGHIPHYVLYAIGGDRVILRANLIGIISFGLAGWFLAKPFGAGGVAAALLISVVVIGGYKQWKQITLFPGSSFTTE